MRPCFLLRKRYLYIEANYNCLDDLDAPDFALEPTFFLSKPSLLALSHIGLDSELFWAIIIWPIIHSLCFESSKCASDFDRNNQRGVSNRTRLQRFEALHSNQTFDNTFSINHMTPVISKLIHYFVGPKFSIKII
jgi:hypothetical protein